MSSRKKERPSPERSREERRVHHRGRHHKDRERSRSPPSSNRPSGGYSRHHRREGQEQASTESHSTSPRRSNHEVDHNPERGDNNGHGGERSGERSREERSTVGRDSMEGRKEEKRRKWEQRKAEDEAAKKYEYGGAQGSDEVEDEPKKEEPNFGLSGKLTAETNSYRGVVIKYSEPPEARQPSTRWRLYQFKGEEVLPTLYIHRQSAYLIGRDRRVVDLPVDHPSCSGQHAVLQYRLVQYEKKDGSIGKHVRPYMIDLESTNGTYINNQRIEPARYVELKEKDMIKFGFSSREYVLLHENSKDDDD